MNIVEVKRRLLLTEDTLEKDFEAVGDEENLNN